MPEVELEARPRNPLVQEVVANHGPGRYEVVAGPGPCDCGPNSEFPEAPCRPRCASRRQVIKTPSGEYPIPLEPY